jgi:hypothetical protein
MPNNTIIPLDVSENELAKRRTDEELERDRVLLARMYVRGKSQHEMKLTLNALYPDRPLSSMDIHNDLEAIHKMWLNSTLVDFNALKVKELARIDEVERESFDAWDRSKEKHIKYEYEIDNDQVPFSADKVADIKRTKRHKIVEETVGDIRYLDMVYKMIDMRAKILGLYEASKVQIDWRQEAVAAGMREETLDAVKEATIRTLVAAIENAGKDSGLVKEPEIIDAEFQSSTNNQQ